jgi:hypothetical protein
MAARLSPRRSSSGRFDERVIEQPPRCGAQARIEPGCLPQGIRREPPVLVPEIDPGQREVGVAAARVLLDRAVE